MTAWPEAVDPDGQVVGVLPLAELETPNGSARFMVGVDGHFKDVSGRVWVGSRLIKTGAIRNGMGGAAPAASAEFSFIQDPAMPDLIAQIRALGVGYVQDRLIRFYAQHLLDAAEIMAPTLPPVLLSTRRMRKIGFALDGPLRRTIALHFEGPHEFRRRARRLQFTTTDHSKLIGAENPSLALMPTTDMQEESLF